MAQTDRVLSTPPISASKNQSKPPVIKQAKPRDHEAESRKAAKAHPDYKLIKACVEYRFLFGGTGSGFTIDPTDNHFAGPVDCRNCERAEEIITRASKHRPVTLDGLAAKGAAAKLIFALSDRNYIEDYEQDFLQTLAEDVCRFHKLAGGKRNSAPTEPDAKDRDPNANILSAGAGR